jgi:hypothetical protein
VKLGLQVSVKASPDLESTDVYCDSHIAHVANQWTNSHLFVLSQAHNQGTPTTQ